MLDLENLEKAQRVSLTMQVELSLKGALITGSLKPGARLITKEIADKLGTSITPVREALLRLVSAGALQATPAQAFLVPEITIERYNEINNIRKQLEPMAVAAACLRITDSKLDALRELAASFADALEKGSIQNELNAERIFRFTLYQYAEMPTLSALIEQLWIRVGPCTNYLHRERQDIACLISHYEKLLSALKERDVEASQKAIDTLIDQSGAILQRQYLN